MPDAKSSHLRRCAREATESWTHLAIRSTYVAVGFAAFVITYSKMWEILEDTLATAMVILSLAAFLISAASLQDRRS